MSKLVTSQKWVFGALGVVLVFGIGVGVFFWRRRLAQMNNYQSLNNGDNDMNMTALGTSMLGPRTTRELYDAFGEVSDDDDDETTALRQPLARSIGFHTGFLDDDEPSSTYRDEPEGTLERTAAHGSSSRLVEREDSTGSTGSGEGSWEHASRDSH